MAKEKQTPTKDQTTDLTFYKFNSLGYLSILGFIIIELYHLITLLNTMEYSYLIGVVILFNIAMLLVLFTCALQVKVYSMVSTYVLFVFGVYSICRVGVMFALIPFGSTMIILDVLNVAMGVGAILISLDSIRKIKNQRQYIKDGKINFVQLSK